jgi:hypothetical protein
MSVIVPNVVMLNVVTLNVVAPFEKANVGAVLSASTLNTLLKKLLKISLLRSESTHSDPMLLNFKSCKLLIS